MNLQVIRLHFHGPWMTYLILFYYSYYTYNFKSITTIYDNSNYINKIVFNSFNYLDLINYNTYVLKVYKLYNIIMVNYIILLFNYTNQINMVTVFLC